MQGIHIAPDVPMVDVTEVRELGRIMGVCDELRSIVVMPEVPVIDSEELNDLAKICSLQVEEKPLPPVVSLVDCEELRELEAIMNITRNLPDIEQYDKQLKEVNDEIQSLVSQFGDAVIICPDCGHVITENELHSH